MSVVTKQQSKQRALYLSRMNWPARAWKRGVHISRALFARLRAHIEYGLRPKYPGLRHFFRRPTLIESWLAQLPSDTTFIQIGSNDGAQGDPLHNLIIERRWRGALVEPIPFLFERLKQNYVSQTQLTFLNAAVSSVREVKELYYVAPDALGSLTLPYWYDQLGSFDRSHITEHLGDEIEPYICSTKVDCILLEDVIAQVGFAQFDLLHIDVEGHDYEILRQLDFGLYSPKMILFEMKHLRAADRGAAINSLVRNGYKLSFSPSDVLAVNRSFLKSLKSPRRPALRAV